MKTQINKATIEVDFTDVDELRRALDKVVELAEKGLKGYSSNFVNWEIYPKDEIETEEDFLISDLKGGGFKYEEREGVTYVLIQSKLNY